MVISPLEMYGNLDLITKNFLKDLFIFYFMCMSECFACLCLYHMYAVPMEARKGTQMTYHVGAGCREQNPVLCKSSQCS